MSKKIKTRKAVAKRFTITKKGKVQHRTCGQGHFNAREDSKTTRNKRQDKTLSPSNQKLIKKSIH
ncbi:MAG: 50S ribosomal protein L35 [Patescibacteria group bacterium]|jgi:large subunit ribosomal protein L35|nr:50S ribosomal protein L35 [Patescibacteria group bacterium]